LVGSASANLVGVRRRREANPDDLGSRDHDPLVDGVHQVRPILRYVCLLDCLGNGLQPFDRALCRDPDPRPLHKHVACLPEGLQLGKVGVVRQVASRVLQGYSALCRLLLD
jgi:hypothetical protein